jgi:hypothetical protein
MALGKVQYAPDTPVVAVGGVMEIVLNQSKIGGLFATTPFPLVTAPIDAGANVGWPSIVACRVERLVRLAAVNVSLL